jgi:glutamate-1-semialdehyde 2,1-aminomutase
LSGQQHSTEKSASLYAEAIKCLPAGVDSPVRAFQAVGGTPRFIAGGSGCQVTDVDGNTYIDYVASWGPLVLGHAHPAVVEAIAGAARLGTTFGAPCEQEVRLASIVKAAFPSIDLVRFVNSGTEATMTAIRLARAATGRDLVLKFDGCYHGHSDGLLVKAGSGPLTLGIAGSAGVPADWAARTLTVPFNDLGAVEQAFETHPGQIAALIVEPVAGNMGVIPPAPGFLEGLRRLSRAAGAVLIFDEVITGFRIARGGAQEYFGLQGELAPDLTCLGKIIGGGLPVGAFGGRRDLMELVAPLGPVYQAGTLSGNPLAMAAGIATLERLDSASYAELERRTGALVQRLSDAYRENGVTVVTNRVGSMFTTFFADTPITDLATAQAADRSRYGAFFHAMLDRGVYFAPSQFEAAFVSLAHDDEAMDQTVAAVAGWRP